MYILMIYLPLLLPLLLLSPLSLIVLPTNNANTRTTFIRAKTSRNQYPVMDPNPSTGDEDANTFARTFESSVGVCQTVIPAMDASEEVASPVTLVLGKYLFFVDCVPPEKHPTAFAGWWAKGRYREEEEERATSLPDDDDTPRYIFYESAPDKWRYLLSLGGLFESEEGKRYDHNSYTTCVRDVVEIRISMFLCVRSSFDATREHFERKFVALSSSSRLRGGKLCEKRRETKMVVSQNCERLKH